jgi:hypothetical protein
MRGVSCYFCVWFKLLKEVTELIFLGPLWGEGSELSHIANVGRLLQWLGCPIDLNLAPCYFVYALSLHIGTTSAALPGHCLILSASIGDGVLLVYLPIAFHDSVL